MCTRYAQPGPMCTMPLAPCHTKHMVESISSVTAPAPLALRLAQLAGMHGRSPLEEALDFNEYSASPKCRAEIRGKKKSQSGLQILMEVEVSFGACWFVVWVGAVLRAILC